MENFTNEQVKLIAEFYESMGVSSVDYLVGSEIKNIFDFLSIKPDVDENGNRKLTPYELLGVLPNIVDKKERPIVFFIKNKLKNIKLIKNFSNNTFTFSDDKNKKDNDSLIEFVLKSYKTAMAQNNMAQAERQLDMLNMITGGKAKHYIRFCYDYTKFYKQMKKQLLIDLFSHFFLIYLMKKRSLIKKGLIIKNKKFKPYSENKFEKIDNSDDGFLPQIKSIRIDEAPEDCIELFNLKNNKESEFSEIEFSSVDSLEKTKNSSELKKSSEKKSFIKKIRKQLFRKDKKKNKYLSKQVNNINIMKNKRDEEVSYE